jgi:hypothetical protein
LQRLAASLADATILLGYILQEEASSMTSSLLAVKLLIKSSTRPFLETKYYPTILIKKNKTLRKENEAQFCQLQEKKPK